MIGSPKQDTFARNLLAERVVPVGPRLNQLTGETDLTVEQARKAIGWLLSLPKVEKVALAPAAAVPGVYVTDEGIYQVTPNKAMKLAMKAATEAGVEYVPSGGERVYAKVWTDIHGERLNLNDEHVHGEWQFAPGAIYRISPLQKMDLDQAKRFMLVFGQCAKCGRKLKAAKSVEAGIGPVCRQYFQGHGEAA